ncbi:MAG: hypothetical protein ACRENS_10595 [Candidatus Eiseniibacteriota bacterium]
MITSIWSRPALVAASVLILSGCGASTAPHGHNATVPDQQVATPSLPIVAGAADSVGSAPGSPGAKYGYRFRMTDPGSGSFTFYDRDLSFYFRPAPDALRIQIENKQNKSVWIDWDRSQMMGPDGTSSKPAHATTAYRDRFSAQPPVEIRGLDRYSDYLFPLDYLLDPGGSDQQLHRPMFPEDDTAPNYNGRDFGVDLSMRVDNQPRVYSFRFRVVSVLPR